MKNTAIVTGVSRAEGLGFAVAGQLAERGFRVIITARDEARAETLAARIREGGREVTAMGLDLSDLASIRETAARVAQEFDRVDVLINNATNGPDFKTRNALDVDVEKLAATFAVDVFGAWALIQALLPLLRKADAARIVNVSSAGARQIGRNRETDVIVAPAYALAKHTLVQLTATLASSFASSPILINAVDPGSIATQPDRADPTDRSPSEAAKGVIWAATLPASGPSGGFFLDGLPVPAEVLDAGKLLPR